MRENKRERARERVRAEQAGRAPQHLTLFPSGACYEHQLKAHGPSRTCNESQEEGNGAPLAARAATVDLQGLGFRGWSLGVRVEGIRGSRDRETVFNNGLGFGVQGVGVRDQGLGFRV